VAILEKKIFEQMQWLNKYPEIKRLVFHSLIEEQGMELIAKKVSNLSGDIRAAFDIFKTILTDTQTKLLKKEFD